MYDGVASGDLVVEVLDHGNGVRELRLVRSPANAINRTVMDEVELGVRGATAAGARALLLTSGIDRFFAAGADIDVLDASFGVEIRRMTERFQNCLAVLEAAPLPTIAVVTGLALGGGLELALACDLIFVALDEKVQLGLPEVGLGVIPAGGGTQRLSRLVGKHRALALLYSGRRFGPAEALDMGLATHGSPPDQVREDAMVLAAELAAGPTVAYAEIKACVLEALHGDIERGLARERLAADAVARSTDAAEGLRAFLEERPPSFRGG